MPDVEQGVGVAALGVDRANFDAVEAFLSVGTEAAGVTLLWGLVAFGQIRLRRINGYKALTLLLEQERAA